MNQLAEIISRNEDQIRSEWIDGMSKSIQRADLISKAELDDQCRAILAAIVAGVKSSGDVDGAGWDAARELFQSISASRARQGFSPIDVATYVLSLKQPLFAAIRKTLKGNQDEMFETIWAATELLDRLAMITT